jgi:hypothetical protein
VFAQMLEQPDQQLGHPAHPLMACVHHRQRLSEPGRRRVKILEFDVQRHGVHPYLLPAP